jgi:hypothetical protein
MRPFWIHASLCGILVAALAACQGKSPPDLATHETKESKKMINSVSIKLGESAAAFVKRYPGVKLVRQPAGLDFYSIDWDERPRGVVTLEHGKNTIVVDDALGLLTSEDQADLKSEGLFAYTVFAGMSVPSPSLIPHDEARIKTYAILRSIMEAGWRQVIERSEPRLSGKARQDYMFATSNLNGLDATYVPTFEDWMRIPSRTPWSFYADGAFLSVEFTRERTLTDPNKPGSYLLTFRIQTATEYFRGYAGPDNRLRWKELLPAELAKVAKLRAEKEAELKAKGVPIDDSYRDPPPPPL